MNSIASHFNFNEMMNYLVIVAYFAAVIAIGFYCSRGEKTSENYLMGGRRVHFLAIGMACMMALLSSVSLVVVPGEICNHGVTLFSISQTLGLALGIPCYLLFTRFYFRLGSFTPYEYLEYRYDGSVRAIVAISGFYSRVMYLGMVVFTTAKIFEASYHWPAWFSILLVGVVGMIYTITGGAKAVIWTDVMQFFVLFGSFFLVMVFLCMKIDGGAWGAIKGACDAGHGFKEFSEPSFYTITPYVRLLFWLMIISAFTAPLTSACSDQISIQRLLSTKNWKEGFKAQIVATGFGMLFAYFLWFTGMAVFTYYNTNPDPEVNLALNQGDRAFFHFVATQLPTPIPGLFIAGMLAAIMSTLSSGMNSMATVWLKEFHARFINKNMTARDEYNVSRKATFWIGAFVILFGLALNFSGEWLSQSVAEVGTIFGVLGACVLPAFLFAVLSDRANSTLIWGITIFGLGATIGGNLWYILSRNAEQFYQKGVLETVNRFLDSKGLDLVNAYDKAVEAASNYNISLSEIHVPAALGEKLHLLQPETLSMGWGGKITWVLPVVSMLLFVILCLPWCFKSIRKKTSTLISAAFGLIFLGIGQWMIMWWFFSNKYIVDHPIARSFAFHLPIDLIGSFIILWFCPHQPKEKCQGLTLSTINMPILKQDK